MALGQVVPPEGARAEGSQAGPNVREKGKRPAENPAYNTAAEMRRNGGSLLRATLNAPADAGKATLADVSLFAVPVPEPKTLRKHDLISIVIREESDFSTSASTELKKEAALEAKVEQFVKATFRNLEIKGGAEGISPPAVKMNASREFKGEATIDRSDTFTARITAEVLDVKPNGTLVLQARKRIKTDEEEQEFVLTGIARAEDVDASNSILSTQIFDLSLQKNHKGAARTATKRGWLVELLDAINPF